MRPEGKGSTHNILLHLIAYSFSDERDFWAPYPDLHYGITLSNFGEDKNKRALFLESVSSTEEFLHRRLMVATRIRFEMSWEVTLSLCEMLSLVTKMKEISRKDEEFQLLIPIRHNLYTYQIPHSVKTKIRDLIKAYELLRNYHKATEPFIESSTLVYLEKLFSEINKPLFKRRLKRQFKRYPFLQTVYPLMEKAMNNYSIEIPLASIVMSPKFPRSTPSLTLQESFKQFNIKRARQIEHRFNKLVDKLTKVDISSEEEFSSLAKDLGCDYLDVDDIFDWLIPSYQSAIDTLPTTCEEYISAPINTPLNLIMDKLLEFEKTKEDVLRDMNKKKEDMQSGIFLANTLFAGTSSIHLVENLSETVKKLDFHSNMNYELRQQTTKATVLMFFLEIFLINGVSRCPISGYFEECTRCLLFDLARPKFLDKLAMKTTCPVFELLDGMSIKIVNS